MVARNHGKRFRELAAERPVIAAILNLWNHVVCSTQFRDPSDETYELTEEDFKSVHSDLVEDAKKRLSPFITAIENTQLPVTQTQMPE
jgi:hypothetical protein